MHLHPYLHVDGLPFTAARTDVLRLRGRPRRQERNNVGLTALDYGDVVYRFQDCGRLEEVTAWAEVLHLGPVAVPFRSLAAFVRGRDGGVFERAGFLVSPLYGIAFVPGEPAWVTALARHALRPWEALRPGLAGGDDAGEGGGKGEGEGDFREGGDGSCGNGSDGDGDGDGA